MFKHLIKDVNSHNQPTKTLTTKNNGIQSPLIHQKQPPTPGSHQCPRSSSKKSLKLSLFKLQPDLLDKIKTKSHCSSNKDIDLAQLTAKRNYQQTNKIRSIFSNDKPLTAIKSAKHLKSPKAIQITNEQLVEKQHKKEFKLIQKIKELRKIKRDKEIVNNEEEEYQINIKQADNLKNQDQEERLKLKQKDNSIKQISAEEQFCQKKQYELQSYSESSIDSLNSTKSLHLELESKIKPQRTQLKQSAFVHKVNSLNLTIQEQIKEHLDIIEYIYTFLQESIQFHSDLDEWQELHFLLLKKYYIERQKVVHFLKKYPMKNPFSIANNKISLKEALNFMKTDEGCELISQIQSQNKRIKIEMSTHYNKFQKSKVGEKINLFEVDNFSQWIIQQLWIEFTLTQYTTAHEKKELNRRLCRILQIIFLISQVNGHSLLPFYSCIEALDLQNEEEYIKQAKIIFEKELLYK